MIQGDSLGSSLTDLGDGGSTTGRSGDGDWLRKMVTKSSRGDLSHNGNEGDRESHSGYLGGRMKV